MKILSTRENIFPKIAVTDVSSIKPFEASPTTPRAPLVL